MLSLDQKTLTGKSECFLQPEKPALEAVTNQVAAFANYEVRCTAG